MADSLNDVSYVSGADAPYVSAGAGIELKVWRVDLEAGLWIISNRFEPGFETPKHRHTGVVDAFTLSGSWLYAEYGERYTAGSYVYEPANSVHTLQVPADNTEPTEVVFTINGALLYLDDDDNVVSVTDSKAVLDGYVALCDAEGLTPKIAQ